MILFNWWVVSTKMQFGALALWHPEVLSSSILRRAPGTKLISRVVLKTTWRANKWYLTTRAKHSLSNLLAFLIAFHITNRTTIGKAQITNNIYKMSHLLIFPHNICGCFNPQGLHVPYQTCDLLIAKRTPYYFLVVSMSHVTIEKAKHLGPLHTQDWRPMTIAI